jgi:hypothetical protein
MKKLAFILGSVVTNMALVLSIISEFNTNNIPLRQAEWFNGFDITLLFPNSIPGITIFYGSIIGLVFINIVIAKTLKAKSISLI